MLKQVGHISGLIVGSALSPTWVLLNFLLKDYFNLKYAMTGPFQMLGEFNRFIAIVNAQPHEILFGLCPKLIFALLVGSLFVMGCSYLFSHGLCLLAARLRAPKPVSQV
jgi:hypothetical protein